MEEADTIAAVAVTIDDFTPENILMCQFVIVGDVWGCRMDFSLQHVGQPSRLKSRSAFATEKCYCCLIIVWEMPGISNVAQWCHLHGLYQKLDVFCVVVNDCFERRQGLVYPWSKYLLDRCIESFVCQVVIDFKCLCDISSFSEEPRRKHTRRMKWPSTWCINLWSFAVTSGWNKQQWETTKLQMNFCHSEIKDAVWNGGAHRKSLMTSSFTALLTNSSSSGVKSLSFISTNQKNCMNFGRMFEEIPACLSPVLRRKGRGHRRCAASENVLEGALAVIWASKAVVKNYAGERHRPCHRKYE